MAATLPKLPDLNALDPEGLKALILAQHKTLVSPETEIENLKRHPESCRIQSILNASVW